MKALGDGLSFGQENYCSFVSDLRDESSDCKS